MSTNLQDLEHRLNVGVLQRDNQIGRFYAEVKFAEALCEMHPDQAPGWRKLLHEACKRVTAAVGCPDGAVAAAVAEAEGLLAPIGKVAKQYTLHCVGHAHIDMNWKWPWQETVAVTNDTFSTVLRLMEEFDDFHFSQSQTSVYALTKKYNPQMFEQIRRRVKEGRWEVTASHWVEGDKNMALTESLCRHVLYTRKFMKEEFGLEPEDVPIDWQPDTFGHSLGVPTYLARAGVKYYYACHQGNFGPKRPEAFWWKGLEGSRVLARIDRHGYNGYISTESVERLTGYVRNTGLKDYMLVYGVGDHGGGPTRGNILSARDLDTWPIYPRVILSTAKAYFERLEADGDKLETVDEELNFASQGSYTSNARIKRSVRAACSILSDAEAAAALDWALCGAEYPADALRAGWQDTIFQHFHDILPGCNVHDCQEYLRGKLQETAATTGMIETQALRRLAAKVDTSGDAVCLEPGVPPMYLRYSMGGGVGYESDEGRVSQFENSDGGWPRKALVFNPTGERREELATATVWETDVYCLFTALQPWGTGAQLKHINDLSFSVRTPSGKVLPAQLIHSEPYWYCRCARIVFPIEPLGGAGYGMYTLLPEACEKPVRGAATISPIPGGGARNQSPLNRGWILENDLVRVQVSARTGAVHSLVEKKSGLDLVDPEHPAGAMEFEWERYNASSAWTASDSGPATTPQVLSVRPCGGAAGPYVARVAVQWKFLDSEFTTHYELRRGDPNLYIDIDGIWRQWGSQAKGIPALSVAFPLTVENAVPRYEVPFGSLERTRHDGLDVPALRWARVSGTIGRSKAGCLLLNDCKHGHSLTANVLRLHLIRGTDVPDPMPEMGEHKMRLALRPFAGTLSPAEAGRAAAALVHPLRVVGTDVHEGALPTALDAVTVSGPGVAVSAVKKAEGADALVVRLIECNGRSAGATIHLDKTVFGAIKKAHLADLMERPIAGVAALKVAANKISVPMTPGDIATVLVPLKR